MSPAIAMAAGACDDRPAGAWPRPARSRPPITSLYPRLASTRAITSPRPRLAPVTRATGGCSFIRLTSPASIELQVHLKSSDDWRTLVLMGDVLTIGQVAARSG